MLQYSTAQYVAFPIALSGSYVSQFKMQEAHISQGNNTNFASLFWSTLWVITASVEAS
jgi:hypothetical protein